jgi:hypothetical protein
MPEAPILQSAATVEVPARSSSRDLAPSRASGAALALEVRDLTKRFGERTAFSCRYR